MESRQAKRLRTANQPGPSWTRGFTACEQCRNRKSKCDNARPVCGQCAKLRKTCVFPDDNLQSPCQEIGERVLEAITELTSLVKSQSQQHVPRTAFDIPDESSCESARNLVTSQGRAPSSTTTPTAARNSVEDDFTVQLSNRATLFAQGTDSVLSWSIFQRPDALHLPLEHGDELTVSTHPFPGFGKEELLRLTDRYTRGVHIMNPVLDLTVIHDMISQIDENGPDWSTQTCLMALSCAIGAINQLCPSDYPSLSHQSMPEAIHSPSERKDDVSLAMQYWGVAVKRLGVAMSQSSIQAVQCLALAGIFCMHLLKPVQAWKYFNLAGAAWHTLDLTNRLDTAYQESNSLKSFTIMQSLYFTIWKSESELALELDVPSPILDNIKFPHTFPNPPEAEIGAEHGDFEHERTWLYYLAEIAARHLINRILRTYHEFDYGDHPSERKVRHMLNHAGVIKVQLMDWHASLPAIFAFEQPESVTVLPPADDLTQILRARFLTCYDLLSRPFVKLCVETPLQLEDVTRSRVVQLASENMRICVSRLSQVAPHSHQGTWFGLRSFATASLILCAVSKARQVAWLSASREVLLPEDWQEHIRMANDILQPFFGSNPDHVTEIFKIVQTVLSEAE